MTLREDLIRRGVIVPAEARTKHLKTLALDGAPQEWPSGKALMTTLIEARRIEVVGGQQAYGWLTATH
jgi:hypothetical protein